MKRTIFALFLCISIVSAPCKQKEEGFPEDNEERTLPSLAILPFLFPPTSGSSQGFDKSGMDEADDTQINIMNAPDARFNSTAAP